MKKTRNTREAGLTLVELLIALALLGFVLLGIAPLFIASMKSNYSANEYTSIHMMARDRLEQLMNKPFGDAALSVGVHGNDQPPKLPDPTTGIPPAAGGVDNPFTITYQVLQYSIASLDTGTTPVNAAFAPTRVTAGGNPFDYKRIDVTVRSGTGPLGIGSRVARVSGMVGNPSPALNLSVPDTCALGTETVCP
jgi:Tfp pilus assembly protein PilV